MLMLNCNNLVGLNNLNFSYLSIKENGMESFEHNRHGTCSKRETVRFRARGE